MQQKSESAVRRKRRVFLERGVHVAENRTDHSVAKRLVVQGAALCLLAAALITLSPTTVAAQTHEDAVSRTARVIDGFERFAADTGSYRTQGAHRNSGQGWFAYTDGGSYVTSAAEILVDGGYLQAESWDRFEYLVYRCKDRIAVFTQADVSPTADDASWWSDNGCTTYPIGRLHRSYFQVSPPASGPFNFAGIAGAGEPTTAPHAVCGHRAVTVQLASGQQPTEGPDVILGTDGDDHITGLGGDDVICGGGGNDTISGGPGNDRLYGSAGSDNLEGGDGNDLLVGGPGHDSLSGQAGADTIYGQAGNDVIDGGLDDDPGLFGGAGNDLVRGSEGADTIWGNGGADALFGGGGSDTVSGGPGSDEIAGGDGNDRLTGASGDDLITGDSGDDHLYGSEGADRIWGGDDNDTIDGGEGPDQLWGDAGEDSMQGAGGPDQLWGGDGDDRMGGGDDVDVLRGEGGIDQLYGGFHGAGPGPDDLDAGPGGRPFVERESTHPTHDEARDGFNSRVHRVQSEIAGCTWWH